MRNPGIALLGILVAVLIGCGDGSDGTDVSMEPGDTPEKTFLAMKAAVMADDYKALFDLFHPDVQKMHLVGIQKAKERDEYEKKIAEFSEKVGKSVAELEAMGDRDLVILSLKVSFEEGDAGKKRYAGAEVGKTDIDGDKALVHFKTDGKDRRTSFVIYGDKWFYHPYP